MENKAYSDALNLILEVDSKPDLIEGRQLLSQKRHVFEEALKTLKKAHSWSQLGALLCFLHEAYDYSLAPIEMPAREKALCANLDKYSDQIEEECTRINWQRAQGLRKTATDFSKEIKHTSRERLLERAIRLAWSRFSPEGEWPYPAVAAKAEVCEFISRCYLERSKLALPKGSSIPEKKLEALNKAWHWAKKATATLNFCQMEIALERDRWEEDLPESWLETLLKEFLSSQKLDFKNPSHWVIAHRARSLRLGDSTYDKELLAIDPSKFEERKELLWLPLFQSYAALRLNNSEVPRFLERAINKLSRVPFSDPLWDATVSLVEEVAKEGKDKWEPVATKLWEICKEKEEQVRLSIQLRWYWAQHQKLYALAFRAAIRQENCRLAAEIADSLKSRPTIKMMAIEKSMRSDEDREMSALQVEVDAVFAAGGFSHHYDNLLERVRELSKHKTPNQRRPIEDIPAGWAAVHFFLLSDEEGYALICKNGEFEKSPPLSLSRLWITYQAWEKARQTDPPDSYSLVEATERVCEALGDAFPFLFEIQENIIFIPHGFLHLLPLHAAKDDGRYLFLDKTCLYLPAWSLAPMGNKDSVSAQDMLFVNWEDTALREQLLKHKWFVEIDSATGRDLIDNLNKSACPPGLLVIICHGQGDLTNPYNSRLLLAEGGITHRELLKSLPSVGGSRVILAACETDFAPSGSGILDEHLSVSAAFLQKAAGEVGGTLFAAMAEECSEFVLAAKANPEKPLYEVLQKKQNEWANKININRLVPFRIMGFPQNK